MGFKEVSSLDAEVTISIGKTDKKTGKAYPKSAEGYYLGSRKVANKKGESNIYFLQTPKGNLGVWGTTDLDRKMGQAEPGTMVRISFTGMKSTPNGEMYAYKVEVDSDNTIDVSGIASNQSYGTDNDDDAGADYADVEDDGDADDAYQDQQLAAAERAAKTKALLGSKGKTAKN